MNTIGNIHIIGKKTLKVNSRFSFKKNIVWIDNETLKGDQEVVSNTTWKLYKEGELVDGDAGTGSE